MGKVTNPFKGVNKVCAQCIRDCKQFENVILINCPKFQSNQSKPPTPYRYANRHRMRKERLEKGK
jgi:hypothetical protein